MQTDGVKNWIGSLASLNKTSISKAETTTDPESLHEGDGWPELLGMFKAAWRSSSGDAFQESLNRLDRRIDWVPMGWQGIYADVRRQLRAVSSRTRENSVVYGPWQEHGSMYLDACRADPVVHGILRKAHIRAECTCVACGRRGIRREVGEFRKTLCAPCAAIQLLECEWAELLSTLWQTDGPSEPECVALETLTPRIRELIKSRQMDGKHQSDLGIESVIDVAPMLPWLGQVLQAVRVMSQLVV
jgi:hypothetical protein